jgi:pyridoxal phosphate enzyme (YggS family)
MVATIRENYEALLDRINQAARSAGRGTDEVRLMVVTKGQPLDKIQAVIEAGARLLGENYAEEGAEKIQALKVPAGTEWHMIGHVQTRKARLVCENFAWVHSLDSIKLAERLDRFAGELNRVLPFLIECNVSGEESKFGLPAWQEDRWDELCRTVSAILNFNNLQARGLMTMAPYLPDSQAARPYFNRLRRLRRELAMRFPASDWSELSMGMSADFETAIQEGATIVRIGEAILGSRSG